jgi:hypothetical protein
MTNSKRRKKTKMRALSSMNRKRTRKLVQREVM